MKRAGWYGSLTAAALLLDPVPAAAQTADGVPPERLEARQWFRDAKFGLFIHWGVYSQLGQGEWVMQNRGIPVESYEWLASTFNPVKFAAAEWVALAKAAGMRYLTITARHHDGFSGRPERGEWTRYLDFMDRQLEELLTGYGPLGGIWFDGMWDKPEADWRLDRSYALIHRLQPAALIVPNHHKAPLPGEDVQTFEQDLPGANTAGFNTATIGALPLETSLTMNGSWGFNLTDRNFKSSRELIQYLVRAAGNDANLLLNVGPRPDGTIQPEAVERLREIGQWLGTYGSSVYGTRGGPLPPRDWGVTTQRGDSVFLHVLDWPDRTLSIPGLGKPVLAATLLATGERVALATSAHGITLTLPAGFAWDPDRVVVLQTAPVRP